MDTKIKRANNPNGRPVGSVNKITDVVRQVFLDHKHNPIERLITEYATNPAIPVEIRFAAEKELGKWFAPQLRTIEHTGVNGSPLETTRINVVYTAIQNKEIK
jgi:hypothetical protein